jgi:RNA 2',3'-cyclic 3'-phosphodiesterase
MRLFVAVDPPPEQRLALDAAIGVRDEQLRWVPPEQWHLTLVFCGEVSEQAVPELHERLARGVARTPAFALRLAGAGSFPRPAGRARVLWVGLDEDTATLSRLAERCAAAARRCGIPVEDRAFRPHLTLARARRDTVDARAYVERLSSYDGTPWQVDSVRLVQSTLGAKVHHETLAEFALSRYHA